MVKKLILGVLLFATFIFPYTSQQFFVSTSGNDGNVGTFAAPFLTISQALSVSDTLDTVSIIADGTYLPTAPLTPLVVGTNRLPLLVRGVNSSGIFDGTKAVISGASLPASSTILNCNGLLALQVKNIVFTSATGDNITFTDACNSSVITFMDCVIKNSAGSGIYSLESGSTFRPRYIRDSIVNNAEYGLTVVAVGRSVVSEMHGCYVAGNGKSGIKTYLSTSVSSGRPLLVTNSIVSDNDTGIVLLGTAAASSHYLINNLLTGNVSHGIAITDAIDCIVMYNNASTANGGYGYYLSNYYGNFIIDRNSTYNNTLGVTNVNSGVLPGAGNITSDPQIGADFKPATGSPLYTNGLQNVVY